MDITSHGTFLPRNDPDASLTFYRETAGITDDERRTIVEMMAKGTYATTILATAVLDCAFRDPAGNLIRIFERR